MTGGEGLGLLRSPQEIIFAPGSVAALPRILAGHGQRVFACVDEAMLTTRPFLSFLERAISEQLTVEVFSAVEPELPLGAVERTVRQARTSDPDVILGFGGGSALDLAKLVALGLVAPKPIPSYYGENKIAFALKPVVAVPTTSGTGAVVTDPERTLKVGVSSPRLIPVAAVVDPLLAHTCPPSVTAFAGVDALCHALESLTARTATIALETQPSVFVGSNLLSGPLALDAAIGVLTHLASAVSNGHDRQARHEMALASLRAGIAFSTAGTHLAHAIQYPVGALTHTPHGLGVGLLLPYVLEACLPHIVEQLAKVAYALGVPPVSSSEAAAIELIRRVVELRDRIAVPHTLMDLGVQRDQLAGIVELASTVTRLVENGPGPAPSSLVEPIVTNSWSGRSEIFTASRK
jgi:alcohol dehydrogenase class IV